MSVYSVRLFAGQLTAATYVYTAAAGSTIVVRDVELANLGTAATLVGCAVLPVSGSGSSALVYAPSLAANSTLHWDGRVVLETGDQLQVFAGGYPVSALISGYSLY